MELDKSLLEVNGSTGFKVNLKTINEKDQERIIQNLLKRGEVKFILLNQGTSCQTGDEESSLQGEVILNGEGIDEAFLYIDKNKPYLGILFTADGSKLFEAATEKITQYESRQGQIAVVLDGIVLYAPIVNEVIKTGKVLLNMDYSTSIKPVGRER